MQITWAVQSIKADWPATSTYKLLLCLHVHTEAPLKEWVVKHQSRLTDCTL